MRIMKNDGDDGGGGIEEKKKITNQLKSWHLINGVPSCSKQLSNTAVSISRVFTNSNSLHKRVHTFISFTFIFINESRKKTKFAFASSKISEEAFI